MRMKRLLRRLIEWLTERGMTAEQVLECISYITK